MADEAGPADASGAGTGQQPRDGSGDARVDAALARLEAARELPGSEQVAEYEAVHRVLQDTLATIDES